MCRFFAHLCLFLQMIDIPVPPLSTQVILEAYLQVLEVSQTHNLPILNWIIDTLISGCWTTRSNRHVRWGTRR